jgi:hypothetical protein
MIGMVDLVCLISMTAIMHDPGPERLHLARPGCISRLSAPIRRIADIASLGAGKVAAT